MANKVKYPKGVYTAESPQYYESGNKWVARVVSTLIALAVIAGAVYLLQK